MPAGLDGNPEPVTSPARSELLRVLADHITMPTRLRTLVAIDGASGTGKSTLADELAGVWNGVGVPVVRASIDSFHRPRAERYRRGPDSPEGYYLDSHQLEAFVERLLTPFASGAASVCTGVFDEPTDRPVDTTVELVPERAILLADGLFLHRPELVDHWDRSVFLLADGRREAAWHAYLDRDLPDEPVAREAEIAARIARARRGRYVEGQARYEREAQPLDRADLVIDNDDLAAPRVLGGRLAG